MEDTISDESFRTAETQQVGQIQPIGVPKAAIPLGYAEKSRLMNWNRPEAHDHQIEEPESPRGTTWIHLT